ncbi:MAG: pitrilysin family protein [Gemmatimonadetes bacterium]|nr:pitrilysin family protein [Gemmatimonadota bacterium]MDA1103151.1 pitrilysin family protein [Gemmatimonadota bacterium]
MSLLSIPFERHRLDNGLKVVLAPDRTIPVVAANLWYGVGSRNEVAGKTGFAHLFEHMMFQGSAHVPKNRHFELIERVGGTLNATTWFDRTNYFETVPSNELELALWLESDRMGWMLPAMTQEKLDNQRDVVKNEKRQRYDNQPYGDWDERLQKLMYPEDHPYRHTVIGSMDDIDASTLDDVGSFFKTFYVPNNAVLTVAGDVDPAAALEQIKRYFGDIEPGAPIPPLPGNPSLDPLIGSTVREHVVADVPLTRVIMAFRIPPYSSPDFAVAEVAGSLLGMGRASRFYKRLVRERRVAKSVVTYVFPLMTGASMMLVWATGYPGCDPTELEAAMSEEIDALADAQQSELDRAITLTETDLVRGLERVAERADLLSMFDLYFDDPGRLNRELDRLRAVSLEQVRSFVGERLAVDNRAILVYEPEAGR